MPESNHAVLIADCRLLRSLIEQVVAEARAIQREVGETIAAARTAIERSRLRRQPTLRSKD
jgi:hypothetical protein